MQENTDILSFNDVSKAFPGVQALDEVSISFAKGEVVALLGENGAGKSTLVKILSGAYTRDSGDVFLDGEQLPKQYSTMDARKLGISIIYQELSLMNELSVMENIFISHEPQRIKGVINYKKMQHDTEALLKILNASYISAKARVGDLPLAQKQLVEIAKALTLDCKVLVMDEPTTSLANEDAKKLFEVIINLKNQGITIIYISHRMDEIFRVCDRAVVMRDGKVVGSRLISQSTQDDIVDLMTGKVLDLTFVRQDNFNYQNRSCLLELVDISDGGFISDLNLAVYENEVLGIGGLVGSKRTELFRMVCGIDKMHGGTVKIDGNTVKINSPEAAINYRIGYLSENRKEDGLSLGMSIEENNIHSDFSAVSQLGVISWKKTRSIAKNYISKLNIRGTPMTMTVNLSGGNQQKVSIAKWLHAGCRILIFDEPTRGIDVASKAEIHELIRDFARVPGQAAVVISSEVNELLAVSNRIIVMSKGKVVSELTGDELEQGTLTRHITMKSR